MNATQSNVIARSPIEFYEYRTATPPIGRPTYSCNQVPLSVPL